MSMNRPLRAQRGITLVEVLVALVIMSIGMLGISSLYLETLRANRTAQLRGQAIDLVNDMADRIRANRSGQAAYNKAGGATIPAPSVGTPAVDGCTVATSYKPDDLAKDDLKCWVLAVERRLPRDSTNAPAKTSVAFTPAAGGALDRYTVRVEWTEPSAANPLSYQLIFDVLPPT